MTVNLRDRLFSDTGVIVQNATVQAILVTGGGTDAGTSSVVQATTTTDVNGVWKFTALPDPGAGNWYDVKITNGNQVRWRYGNIQAVLQQVLLGAVIASPHFTSPVVDSGGLTVTLGGLTVTAGNVSVGGAPTAAAAVTIDQVNALTGAAQFGLLSQVRGSSSATTSIDAVYAQPGTAAAAFTSASVASLHAATPTRGAGSTITSAYGLLVDAVTGGNTNNYGAFINAPSGGAGVNYALNTVGKTTLASDGSGVAISSATAPPAAGLLLGGLPGFAGGSVYLIIDAGGVVRKSALGPAS